MRILYSFIVTMRTLIAVWYRERALESVHKEERRGRGRTLAKKHFLRWLLSEDLSVTGS